MSVSPGTPGPPARLAGNLNFILLCVAYFVAALGDSFNDAGQLQLMEALKGEESTRLMALMMFGLFTPYVVLGPLAGWCADRFSRKWTMIAADCARALIVINFALVIPRLRQWGFGPYTVMTTQMMLGMVAAFFSPARQAMVPMLVRSEQLVRANGLIGALAPIGAMLGFWIGGHLVDYAGAVANFRVNSATYTFSALLVLCIVLPRGQHVARPATTLLGPLAEGFAYVRRHRRVGQMILLGALFWGAAGVVYSCVPAIVKELVSDRWGDVGTYRAMPVIGMVLGAAFMTGIGPRLGVRATVLAGLLTAVAGLVLLTFAYMLRAPAVVAAATLAFVGIGGALLLVTVSATLQRFVPDSRRGRVFGVSDMASMGAMVLATGALGLAPIPALDRYVPAILGLTMLTLLLAFVQANRIYRHERYRTLRLPGDVR